MYVYCLTFAAKENPLVKENLLAPKQRKESLLQPKKEAKEKPASRRKRLNQHENHTKIRTNFKMKGMVVQALDFLTLLGGLVRVGAVGAIATETDDTLVRRGIYANCHKWHF